jgi:vacuolar-type H+-ATPase subunit I/STV1
MEKELIITSLIILLVYFYYQQNNQSPIMKDNSEVISNLQSQVNHFQTLYQSRVEKDIRDEEKISDLEEQLTLCEEIINKPQNDVETQTDLTAKNITKLSKTNEFYSKKTSELAELTEKLVEKVESLKKDL